jgi:hypothetical protein
VERTILPDALDFAPDRVERTLLSVALDFAAAFDLELELVFDLDLDPAHPLDRIATSETPTSPPPTPTLIAHSPKNTNGADPKGPTPLISLYIYYITKLMANGTY